MNTATSTLKDWLSIYEQCTPHEREEITIAMLQRIESRRAESVEYFKKTPLALNALPASRLMEVVEVTLRDAYDWLVENCPRAREKLSAYESLTIFYMTQGEKSERDLREAIGAICTVWGVSPLPVATETKPTADRARAE